MTKNILFVVLLLICNFVSYAEDTIPSVRYNVSIEDPYADRDTDTSEDNKKRPPKTASIYYDAVFLSKTQEYDTLYAKKYGNFEMLDSIIRLYYFGGKIIKKESSNIPDNLFSFLNTDVTYFATGLSRFLAERAKAELNEAFFSKMKDKMNEFPELQVIFPQTTAILHNLTDFGYAYIIQILKDAFETDMRSLPQNLYVFKNMQFSSDTITKKGKEAYKNFKERKAKLDNFFKEPKGQWLSLGLFTLQETFNSTNPADLIKTIATSNELKALKDSLKDDNQKNILSAIELSNVISQSLLSREQDRVWITPQQLDTLLQPEIFRIYLGLLLAKQQQDTVNKICFNGTSFETILKGSVWNYYSKYNDFCTEIKSLIRNTYAVYNVGNTAIAKINKANKDLTDADPVALYNYYRTLTNTIRPVLQNIGTFTGNSQMLENYGKVENFLNPAVDMVYHISARKYSSAIFDATILLDNISNKEKGNVTEFSKFTSSFTKYGTMIANVANAQSSDEVKKAIEASALPVGSSAMKRNSNFSIFLNAYVGGYYGQSTEKYCIQDIVNCKKARIQSYGVYAPMGISFNFGFKKRGALSLTANILELGSLVNVYLRDGDNTVLPEDFKVRLIDILSPGFQLSYLIPQTPLSVFGGVNYIPKLYPQADNSYQSGLRWQIGVAIDIPMYKIHIR